MKTAAFPEELATRADAIRDLVARNLDQLLKEQRWSRRAAAAELGLTHTYVNSRAAGDTDMSASDLAMFAEFLAVPVSRFFAEPVDDTNVTPLPRATRRTRPVNGLKQDVFEGITTAPIDIFTREPVDDVA